MGHPPRGMGGNGSLRPRIVLVIGLSGYEAKIAGVDLSIGAVEHGRRSFLQEKEEPRTSRTSSRTIIGTIARQEGLLLSRTQLPSASLELPTGTIRFFVAFTLCCEFRKQNSRARVLPLTL
jgi:hypothetical protein